jgi:hypothetical protein
MRSAATTTEDWAVKRSRLLVGSWAAQSSERCHRFPLPPEQLALLLHLYVQLTRLHRIADRHHEMI